MLETSIMNNRFLILYGLIDIYIYNINTYIYEAAHSKNIFCIQTYMRKKLQNGPYMIFIIKGALNNPFDSNYVKLCPPRGQKTVFY